MDSHHGGDAGEECECQGGDDGAAVRRHGRLGMDRHHRGSAGCEREGEGKQCENLFHDQSLSVPLSALLPGLVDRIVTEITENAFETRKPRAASARPASLDQSKTAP